MKNIVRVILAVVLLAMIMCFTSCGEKPRSEVSPNVARTIMENYLVTKGFDKESDFLSEENIMMIEDVKVYVFSWRTPAGENADKLFGMYAVSADGTDLYEYQFARNEWILDADN